MPNFFYFRSSTPTPSLPSFESGLLSKGNVLPLIRSEKFQNTMLVSGAKYFPSSRDTGVEARNYFSGYVFRGDGGTMQNILTSGFQEKSLVTSELEAEFVTGSPGRWENGVSTSICVQACVETYQPRYLGVFLGYVYLIDAMDFCGEVAPAPVAESGLAIRFPIVQTVCKVNFIHSIPNTSIVGVVWPSFMPKPCFAPWGPMPTALMLAINPEYEKGMAGALEVVKLFNA